jgi:hypothetical protein
MAALFPEIPGRAFQAVDTTQGSVDAASLMSGSASSATSRPSTAAPSRPFSGHAERNVSASSMLKKALLESYVVSAADCLHACHAHLTDPENFWKSINDAYVCEPLSPVLRLHSRHHAAASPRYRYATSGKKQGLVSELGHRLGWLNIFNPMHCDGFYRLDLGKRDQRIVAQMLVVLSMEEPGENVRGAL